jgi:hypothetical protein
MLPLPTAAYIRSFAANLRLAGCDMILMLVSGAEVTYNFVDSFAFACFQLVQFRNRTRFYHLIPLSTTRILHFVASAGANDRDVKIRVFAFTF